jgi:hypothetical protein
MVASKVERGADFTASGEHENLHRGWRFQDFPRRVQPPESRHAHVQNHQVRFQFSSFPDSFPAVECFSAYHPSGPGQRRTQTPSNGLMIVRNQNAELFLLAAVSLLFQGRADHHPLRRPSVVGGYVAELPDIFTRPHHSP